MIHKVFTGATKNQTSAVFDCTSRTPVLAQPFVSGGTLTGGTLKAETSLDGTNFDTTTAPFSFTNTEMSNAIVKQLAYGFPAVRFTIASYAQTYGKTQTTGTGLSDLTIGGTYTPTTTHTYEFIISTAAATDKFKWRKDGGTWSSEISMTGSAQTITDGITATWAATTGHTKDDVWTVTPTGIDLSLSL